MPWSTSLEGSVDNRFDLIRADEVVIQHATTNRQDSRRASEIGQRLREPDDIVIRDTKRQRAFEIWLQAVIPAFSAAMRVSVFFAT